MQDWEERRLKQSDEETELTRLNLRSDVILTWEEFNIDVSTKSLDSLWASEQGSFNTNALEAHMLATRWDVCYKLAVSWVCIVD